TEAQVRAYRIADNQTATLSSWDDDKLTAELMELAKQDYDLDLTGFSADEIAGYIEGPPAEGLTDPDEVPETAPAITQPGDLWLLGDHRLLCGDSTKAEDVARLMAGQEADLFLSDPPYNVAYVGKTKDALTIENDSMEAAEFRAFLVAAFAQAFSVMKPGAAFYIWHADSEGYNFRGAVHDCGQSVRQCLIWKKQALVLGRQDYHWIHEPCLYGWKEGAAHSWYADRKQTTVLEFDRPNANDVHPTMKPVAMFAYQIGNSTASQALVFDPFLGSGTTLIACEQLGRRCFGMELSPQYCDVIVKRWEQFTGKKAERAS
ncbi:MAG: DNA modification methylase, partial [Gemmataceae bacterium]|nr:DNA modification methylase [Gemmataceae bacterium]